MSDASLQASLHRPAGNPPAAVQPVVGQEQQLKQELVNLTDLSSDLFKTGGAGSQHEKAQTLTAAVNFSQGSSSTTSAPSTISTPSTTFTTSATLIGTSQPVPPQQKGNPDPTKKWGERKAANDAGPKLPPALASKQGNTKTTTQNVNVVRQTRYHMPPADSLPPPVSNPSISSSSTPQNQSDKAEDPGSNPNTYNPTETAAAEEYVLDPHFLKHGTRRETLDLEIRYEPSLDGKGKTSAGDSTQGVPTTRTRQPEGLSDRCKWGTGVVASLSTCVVSLLFIDGPLVAERNDANFSNLLPGIGLAVGAILLIGSAFTLGKTHTH